MPTSYPLPTLAATVNEFGISAPSFVDIHESLRAHYRSIYGSDSHIDPDSQDGQLLAIFARAFFDCNQATVAVYNGFSPATAQGEGLSRAVKINGISRLPASSSQVNLLVSGAPGTILVGGAVSGTAPGPKWDLQTPSVIPPSGELLVLATCRDAGPVEAATNTLQRIETPIAGWVSVTNPSPASLGRSVETDAELRRRQSQSTALPARTVLQGVLGAVQGLLGVSQASVFENDTSVTDARGLPPHSIAVVVLGGDPNQIARAIHDRKTPGAYLHGTSSVVLFDDFQNPTTVRFFVPVPIPIQVRVRLKALGPSYTSALALSIRTAIVDYINDRELGQGVDIAGLYLPAQLYGATLASRAYNVSAVDASIVGSAFQLSDIPLAFFQYATCDASHVVLELE